MPSKKFWGREIIEIERQWLKISPYWDCFRIVKFSEIIFTHENNQISLLNGVNIIFNGLLYLPFFLFRSLLCAKNCFSRPFGLRLGAAMIDPWLWTRMMKWHLKSCAKSVRDANNFERNLNDSHVEHIMDLFENKASLYFGSKNK